MYASEANPEWSRLAPRSKTIYRRGLETLERFSDMPIRQVDRPSIIAFRDDLYDYPGKLKPALAVLSNVLRYAHDRGIIEYNHALNLRGLPDTKPIVPWSPEEIDTFLKAAPDRLYHAVMLALYTGQRRSDLIRMRWKDYSGDYIDVVQQKTRKKLSIPVHPNLKKMLDTMPRNIKGRGHTMVDYILTNAHGERWLGDTLTVAISRQARVLGIKSRNLHGLRKSAANMLAEAGCTPHQIASITGHASLRQVEHYTAGANQRKMAKEAMSAWNRMTSASSG